MNGNLGWLSLLLPATLFVVLWERRLIWLNKRQGFISRALLCLAIGQLSDLTIIGEMFGRVIHHMTGLWNVDDMIGHSFYVGAMGYLLCYVLDFRNMLRERGHLITLAVETTLLVMWAFFAFGGMWDTYKIDTAFLETWAAHFYWAVMLLSVGISMACAAFSMLQVARIIPIEQGKATAVLYAAGCVFIVANLVEHVFMRALPTDQLWHPVMINHLLFGAMTLCFSLGAHMSYRIVTRPLVIPDCWPPLGVKPLAHE